MNDYDNFTRMLWKSGVKFKVDKDFQNKILVNVLENENIAYQFWFSKEQKSLISVDVYD